MDKAPCIDLVTEGLFTGLTSHQIHHCALGQSRRKTVHDVWNES